MVVQRALLDFMGEAPRRAQGWNGQLAACMREGVKLRRTAEKPAMKVSEGYSRI